MLERHQAPDLLQDAVEFHPPSAEGRVQRNAPDLVARGLQRAGLDDRDHTQQFAVGRRVGRHDQLELAIAFIRNGDGDGDGHHGVALPVLRTAFDRALYREAVVCAKVRGQRRAAKRFPWQTESARRLVIGKADDALQIQPEHGVRRTFEAVRLGFAEWRAVVHKHDQIAAVQRAQGNQPCRHAGTVRGPIDHVYRAVAHPQGFAQSVHLADAAARDVFFVQGLLAADRQDAAPTVQQNAGHADLRQDPQYVVGVAGYGDFRRGRRGSWRFGRQ
ncbi:hypothetical protein D3C87_1322610 [compost metagenome]